jgi:hypothetical protein
VKSFFRCLVVPDVLSSDFNLVKFGEQREGVTNLNTVGLRTSISPGSPTGTSCIESSTNLASLPPESF